MSEIRQVNYNSTKAAYSKPLEGKWWSCEGEKHAHLVQKVEQLKTDQQYRSLMNLKHARLYSNIRLQGLSAYDYSKMSKLPTNRLTLNVVKAVVETASAKIAKNKPRPLFLTERGNHSQQLKAKKLTQYIGGMFYELNIYDEAKQHFTESAVFGTGAMKVYQEHGDLKVEKVLIDEIIVDDYEALYGDPRSLYQCRSVAKEVLLEMCKNDEQREAVKRAGESDASQQASRNERAEMVAVYEGWHLRSGPEAKDGRHVIAVDTMTLLDEEWDKDYFPFVFLPYARPLLGFYGQGLVPDIVGVQLEINRMLRNVAESTDLFAKPRVFMQKGSSITKPLDNRIGAQYEYVGSAPTFITPGAMAPDVYRHLWELYNRAFEVTGVSQLSATGRKPAGLDSGVALREYNDIESERFSIVAQAYENSFIELSKLIIAETRDLQKNNGSTKVKTKSGKFMQTIDWKDVDLDDDKFMMQAFPTNFLSGTPAGKFEKVQEMVKAGFVDKAHAMSLLDFPDVEQFTSLETAAVEDVQYIIENILESGTYESPDPVMNLQLASRMMQSAYLRAKRDNVAEDRLDMMRDFMTEASAMLINATPQPPAPPAAPPQGAPAPGIVQQPDGQPALPIEITGGVPAPQ